MMEVEYEIQIKTFTLPYHIIFDRRIGYGTGTRSGV
jgi:hypothetical protein